MTVAGSRAATQGAEIFLDTLSTKPAPSHADIPQWKPYTLEKRETLVFDDESKLSLDPRGAEREFYARVPFIQRGTF